MNEDAKKREDHCKVSELLSKLDPLIPAFNQVEVFRDEDCKFLQKYLIPAWIKSRPEWQKGEAEKRLKELKSACPTFWKFFIVNLCLAKIQHNFYDRMKSLYPEWKENLAKKWTQRFMADLYKGKIKLQKEKQKRDKTYKFIGRPFNWLEPHTQVEYAEATGKSRKTIGRFLKHELKAEPICGYKHGRRNIYPSEISIEVLKKWLNDWLTEPDLEISFSSDELVEKLTGTNDRKVALGTILLRNLEFKEGNKRLKKKARKIILEALPGSKPPEKSTVDLLNLFPPL